MKTPAQLHASLLTSNGIDLKKDYFKLTAEELSKVEKIRKAFKFSGRNKNGLPPCRQFYIHCQKAHKENQPHTIPEPQPSRLTIAINHANGIVSRFDEDDPYGWEVISADEKPSAQWEHTLLMTDHGVEVLTY